MTFKDAVGVQCGIASEVSAAKRATKSVSGGWIWIWIFSDMRGQRIRGKDHLPRMFKAKSESDKGGGKLRGGWKNRGRGKHTVKPLPKNGLGPPPPPMIRFAPPRFVYALSFPLRKRAQTRPIPLSKASKTGFGEHPQSTASPPKICTMRFPPPFSLSPKQ